jgi:hypothetical protein
MNLIVHILPEQVVGAFIPQKVKTCRIAERATALKIDPVNGLGR